MVISNGLFAGGGVKLARVVTCHRPSMPASKRQRQLCTGDGNGDGLALFGVT